MSCGKAPRTEPARKADFTVCERFAKGAPRRPTRAISSFCCRN